MSGIKFHTLLLILISTLTITCSTAPTIAKPNCNHTCGDISIPFPFGTNKSCYADSAFLVTCNYSSDPPTLFWQDTTIPVTEISLEGQIRIKKRIAKSCYLQNGTNIYRSEPGLSIPVLFTVNNTANKLIVIGCDSLGYFSGSRLNIKDEGKYYVTGCMATCTEMADLERGSCSGTGCCISNVPEQVYTIDFDLRTFGGHVNVSEFNNCTYGAIVEESTFIFSPDDVTNLRDVERLPMVVDWAIRNETCESAAANPLTTNACLSSNGNGDGYRCRCQPGYQGNPYLTEGCRDINECGSPEINTCTYKQRCKNTPGNFTCHCPKWYRGDGIGKGGCTRTYKRIAVTALGIIVVMLVIFLAYLVLDRRRSKKQKDMIFIENGGSMLQDKLRAAGGTEMKPNSNHMATIFSSRELRDATDNFHKSKIIGQGGFGTVYKGTLVNKKVVAIKKSKEVDPDQIEQFVNEFMVLSQISHRNVVRLLGCCLETEVPYLVYEFVDNGTLYEHIHNPDKKWSLGWGRRLNIATETADVLSYLHAAAATPIIHRDVKSANILLDHEFKARISDFGASKLVPMDQTQLPTMVLGTLGYLDPEYMQTHQLTDKSDVYSFGVVLVELITGKKVINYGRPEEEKSLSSFFHRKLKQGRLFDVLDEAIKLNENQEQQVAVVAKLAQVCLNVRGEDRPKEVAMELESLKSGGRNSWAKQEENADEIKSCSGKGYDDKSYSGNGFDGIIDGDCYSTSMSYDSLKDHTGLSGGR